MMRLDSDGQLDSDWQLKFRRAVRLRLSRLRNKDKHSVVRSSFLSRAVYTFS